MRGLACVVLLLVATAATARDPAEVAVDLPECEGATVIATTADWELLAEASLSVFCVRAGDHRAAGRITVKRSGTREQPIVLRSFPSDTHPAN